MKNNPFQKTKQRIIRNVYGNVAVLSIRTRIKEYNSSTGELSESVATVIANVFISNPRQISDAVVDGKNYMKGDLHVNAAYLEIAKATAPAGRTVRAKDAGIDMSSDTLTFGDTEYNFIKITALDFFGGKPSELKLQLRAR